jgi:hypothetical protein
MVTYIDMKLIYLMIVNLKNRLCSIFGGILLISDLGHFLTSKMAGGGGGGWGGSEPAAQGGVG